jgi:epoxyqueuosine reductase
MYVGAAPRISAAEVKAQAIQAGFDLCGIAGADSYEELGFLREWIDRGFHGEMHYMARTAERRGDVRAVLPSAQSVIVLGTVYNTAQPYSTFTSDPAVASIARYAWGDDYHVVIEARLKALANSIAQLTGDFAHRAYVDTGPIQERVYAQYAGLGWIGKNTCLINRDKGSWVFLSTIICDLVLEPDGRALDHCGRCTLCIDACPTGAITAPYQLDSRRCLSYLTIEIKGAIPSEHREAIATQAYGCDICQDVCPWNRRPAVSDDAPWQPRDGLARPKLLDLWQRSDDDLRRLLKGSPMKRAGIRRLRRNLAVALGNSGDDAAAQALQSIQEETALDPLVKEHVGWALEKLDGQKGRCGA